MSGSERQTTTRRAAAASGGGGDAVYFLGLIGSLVFFWQEADSFGEYVLAVLEAFVWPALLAYQAFEALLG